MSSLGGHRDKFLPAVLCPDLPERIWSPSPFLRALDGFIIFGHGQQTDCPRTSRNRATPRNRWRDYWSLSQLRESCRTDRWLTRIHRTTRQGTGKAQRTSGNRRPHGRAPARNREDWRLRVAQEAAEEIHGDASGSAAIAVAWPEKSRLSVVQF